MVQNYTLKLFIFDCFKMVFNNKKMYFIYIDIQQKSNYCIIKTITK